jgi:hypothetical protein
VLIGLVGLLDIDAEQRCSDSRGFSYPAPASQGAADPGLRQQILDQRLLWELGFNVPDRIHLAFRKNAVTG